MPKISACGGRQGAYKDFCNAVKRAGSDDFIALLVDSESPVKEGSDAWAHLLERDGWQQPGEAAQDSAHLMVQCMEGWFLADKVALAKFFGSGFNPNALPGHTNVEEISKADLELGLRSATRSCKPKGEYHKGSHSFVLLGQIDPNKVMDSSRYAKRLVEVLHDRASV